MHDFIDPSNCCDPKSKVFVSCLHLLWLGCSAEVHLARGDSCTLTPFGKRPAASSCFTPGTTMQLPPAFQSTGVATLRVAVSCRLSITLRISSKFLPVVAG